MPFRKLDILKAFAVVHIFETSKAIGDPSTVAVLSDRAGISYGFSQFTHRSGSLKKVCTEYLKLGGTIGADVIKDRLPNLANAGFISKYSNDNELKSALRSAGKTAIMRQAQENVAVKYYMQPSVDACDGSGFVLPISLAVVYDANNQGGYVAVRDNVTVKRSDFNSALAFEKAWITSFCAKRKHWLATRSKSIVHKTVYRPEFFLDQIGRSNWNLDFPMSVHGHKLTATDLPDVSETDSAAPQDSPNPPPLDSNLGEKAAEDFAGTAGGTWDEPAAGTGGPGTSEPPPPPNPTVVEPEVHIEKIEANTEPEKEVSGLNATWAGISGFVTTAGSGVIAFLGGAKTEIILGLFGAAAVIGAIYVWKRFDFANKEKQRQFDANEAEKKRAHEMQLALVQTASSPDKTTVRIV